LASKLISKYIYSRGLSINWYIHSTNPTYMRWSPPECNSNVTRFVEFFFAKKKKKSRGLNVSAITGLLVWETQHERRKLQLHSLHGYAINHGSGHLLPDVQSTVMVRLQCYFQLSRCTFEIQVQSFNFDMGTSPQCSVTA
jgi:hypothetical protein